MLLSIISENHEKALSALSLEMNNLIDIHILHT